MKGRMYPTLISEKEHNSMMLHSWSKNNHRESFIFVIVFIYSFY